MTLSERLRNTELIQRRGRIVRTRGAVIEASGPDACVGEICLISSAHLAGCLEAEVIGIDHGHTLLFPYGNPAGISAGCEVLATGRIATAPVSMDMGGHILDAFGCALDPARSFIPSHQWPLLPPHINPLQREPVTTRLHTGVRVIDHFLTLGRGQKIGLFAGAGVGKTSLLQQIIRGTAADLCVIALVGERGREVLDFVQQVEQAGMRQRTVIVVATSDQPAILRHRAALYATAIAEFHREQGQHVLLVMDSVTRFGMATREMGLAVGDMPTTRGYTVGTFAALTRLVERCGGLRGKGSVSGIYTVLVEGDDPDEPLADAMRATLDGHILLAREQANERRFPAVDLLRSVSRVMPAVVDAEARAQAAEVVRLLAFHERYRELINLGVYEAGSNPRLDAALTVIPEIYNFTQQLQAQSVALAAGAKLAWHNSASVLKRWGFEHAHQTAGSDRRALPVQTRNLFAAAWRVTAATG